MHRTLAAFLLVAAVGGAQVTIDADAARAVMRSVQDPKLTLQTAYATCDLPGNLGLIRKENSYARKATTQDCAEALVAAAHGTPTNPAFRFGFDQLKRQAASINAVLHSIDENPVAFKALVTQRIGRFSPALTDQRLVGYLVTGGPAGGFAFGEPAFYQNLARFDELDVARIVMTHELYHAVQSTFQVSRKDWWRDPAALNGPNQVLAQQCLSTAELFNDLYKEGSASYVGDVFLLRKSTLPEAVALVKEMQDGIDHLSTGVTLLELSVTGLNAHSPVSYDAIYPLGFMGSEIEYKLGYAMTRALVEKHGDAALTDLLTMPEYTLIDSYTELPSYGKDSMHPALGPNTLAAADRLRKGCVRLPSKQPTY